MLLSEQHSRLKEAVDAYFSGKDVQALNIAITLRVLVHETSKSRSLLSRLNQHYWELPIHHRPVLNPNAVFAVPVTLQAGGDGDRRGMRASPGLPASTILSL